MKINKIYCNKGVFMKYIIIEKIHLTDKDRLQAVINEKIYRVMTLRKNGFE